MNEAPLSVGTRVKFLCWSTPYQTRLGTITDVGDDGNGMKAHRYTIETDEPVNSNGLRKTARYEPRNRAHPDIEDCVEYPSKEFVDFNKSSRGGSENRINYEDLHK